MCTVMHVDCVSKINSSVPLDKVYGLSFRISTGLVSTLNIAKSKKGSTVAVFGLGALGLAAAEGAKIAGASRIIGVDLNPNRFESAKKFGVTEFVNPKDHNKPVQEVIFEITNGGVDRSIEYMGHVDAVSSINRMIHHMLFILVDTVEEPLLCKPRTRPTISVLMFYIISNCMANVHHNRNNL
ncbi:hypothetical protein AgCh_021299 [Apium graveolens]